MFSLFELDELLFLEKREEQISDDEGKVSGGRKKVKKRKI